MLKRIVDVKEDEPRTLFLFFACFLILNILIFYSLFESGIATIYGACVFFFWVSVFNLFVVSVLWSFMADLFTNGQADGSSALLQLGVAPVNFCPIVGLL
ncbi:MAG: hypothetical protein ACE5HC_01015 [Candidatus Binatia bacterium]